MEAHLSYPALGVQLGLHLHLVAAEGVEVLALHVGVRHWMAVPGVTVMIKNNSPVKAFQRDVGYGTAWRHSFNRLSD
jgi:hypothetical protein